MQRQLNKTERYANEIANHKEMSKQTSVKLMAEVQLFVKRYKEKAEVLDEKGRSMMSTYSKLLVSGACVSHVHSHYYTIRRRNSVRNPRLIVRISLPGLQCL